MDNTPPDMPDLKLKAGATIEPIVPGVHSWFVIETPEEIREKQKKAMAAARDTMGLADEDDIVVKVTALDVYVGEQPEIEAVDGSIHPGMIGRVKEVTDRFWEAHLEEATRPKPPEGAPEGMPDDVAKALGALGVDLSQVQAYPFPDGAGGAFGIDVSGGGIKDGPHGNSQPMTLDQYNEGNADVECCCGHKAVDHKIGEHTVEECGACPCTLFHTHAEPGDEAGGQQAQD